MPHEIRYFTQPTRGGLPMNPLRVLQDEVQACRRCAHGSTRTQIVFAKGDPLSTLCFVGEAPGEEEDAQGIPFVGDSGKLLDKQVAAMREYAAAQGIAFPADPYVCNVLKCRPPGNKLLHNGSDIETCRSHLWRQLRELPNLRVLVALGKTAAIALMGLSEESIPRASAVTMAWLREHAHADPVGALPLSGRGQPTSWPLLERGVRVYPTYHPAYLLRQPNNAELHRAVWADLKLAVEALR